ncbi:putative mitogen-activated protein kinase 14C [Drosophila bipectinata]|uniref:putative mitogen-activated protein kinase 14C n=1 Tax=Drosophila bipectinata TaxID=42026 RepID=UPI001C892C14|nr:putative mitogen-activated protein kinase 14C [Drosophila bipectinata]
MPGFYSVEVNNKIWVIPDIYRVVEPLGRGSFGQVAKVELRNTKIQAAMKKLLTPFESEEDAKRVYREIKLLKHMNHRNVISLLDVFHPPSANANPTWDDFQEVFLVTELMQKDLHQVIRSIQLSERQVQAILFQILKGLKYIHSAGVLHRDLKPGNIAVNENCELRILDFGMARLLSMDMTERVCTLWYRAPEILFGWGSEYTKAIDMWSVGCILAELISGRPLFPGTKSDQIKVVIEVMGKPSEEFISGIRDSFARQYLERFPPRERMNFREIFPAASPNALDLLEKMLEMVPHRRITVEQALTHPYFEGFSDPYSLDEDTAPLYDQNFENMNLPINCWKELIMTEIKNFKPPPCFLGPMRESYG